MANNAAIYGKPENGKIKSLTFISGQFKRIVDVNVDLKEVEILKDRKKFESMGFTDEEIQVLMSKHF